MKAGAILGGVLLAIVAVGAAYWISQSGVSASTSQSVAENASTEPEPSKTGPHPKAVLVEETYNFGIMKMGDSGKHEFVVRNEGEAPLILGTPQTTCQCTVSEAAKKPIPPGGEGTITLEWTPTGPAENFDKGAIIRTNDPKMREIRLTVNGRVDHLIQTEPAGVWNIGEVRDDKEHEIAGMIYSRLLEDLAIESIESSNPLLTAEAEPVPLEELEQYEAKSGYRVSATLSPGMPIGKFNETLTIKTNAEDEEFAEMKVEIAGTRHGPIQILPTPGVNWNPAALALDLGRFPAAEGKSATISMFVSGLPEGEELKFESVKTSHPYVEVELDRDENFASTTRHRYALTFRVTPDAPATTHRGATGAVRVDVTTNHPEAQQMKFFVQMISTK